jgi:pSer/pThr/pTyr-binding forkhead associated (FHA) protein
MALTTPWRQQITLPDEGELVIGRDVEPLLGHPVAHEKTQISRRHIRFSRVDNGVLRVMDLDSTNGTYLDGVEIGSGGAIVRPGQELRLAQDVVCRIIRINEHGEPEA